MLVGALVFVVMSTWHRGRQLLSENISRDIIPIDDFLKSLADNPPVRVKGTAIFMTGSSEGTPLMLQHHLKRNQVLHEQVLLVTVKIKDIPKTGTSGRLEITKLDQGFHRVIISFGFMEHPDVPKVLSTSGELGSDLDYSEITYYVGHQVLIPREETPKMARWRESLFLFLSRNAAQVTGFYRLPTYQVIELGIPVKI